jgi:hypothetical protein
MDKEQLTGVLRIFVPSVVAWFSARGLVAADLVGPMTDMVINTLVGIILLGAMIWSFVANSKTAQIAKVADMPDVKKVVTSVEIAEGTLKDHDKVVER